jgi:hypothetical protein
MLYTKKNSIFVAATVLDIERHLYYNNHIVAQNMLQYVDDMIFEDFTYSEDNIALYQLIKDEYRKVTYIIQNRMHDEILVSELQISELALIELLKDIDCSAYATDEYFNTDYTKFYGEDTNEVTYKSIFVACAQLLAKKLNISLNDALDKCSKTDIYGSYMQAEPCDEIVEYVIKHMQS